VFTADWSLVWWNTMWSALHGDPAVLPATERNLARALFGHGAAHAAMRPFHSERAQDTFAASIVADLYPDRDTPKSRHMNPISNSPNSAQSAIAANFTPGLSRTRSQLFCERNPHLQLRVLRTQPLQLGPLPI
jgi:hypothetical protein